MAKLPTDLEILNDIYDRYYDDFHAYSDENKIRETKIYIPLEIETIAKKMGVDNDIIFGRLYYHLRNRYNYKNQDGTLVDLFTLEAGKERNCVNFPYLASVLAELREKHNKYRTALIVSVFSIAIAVISLVISLIN